MPCVLAGLAGGAAYFGSMELDATKPIMVGANAPLSMRTMSLTFPQGIDPLLFFGGATLSCMGTYRCLLVHLLPFTFHYQVRDTSLAP